MQSPPLPTSLHISLSTSNSFCSLLENGSFHPPAGANCTRGWIEELSLGEDSVVFDCLQPQWTEARQAPLSMGFSRPEYWKGLPFPSPGDLPDPPGMEWSPASPALAGRFLTAEPRGKLLGFSEVSLEDLNSAPSVRQKRGWLRTYQILGAEPGARVSVSVVEFKGLELCRVGADRSGKTKSGNPPTIKRQFFSPGRGWAGQICSGAVSHFSSELALRGQFWDSWVCQW